MKRKALPGKDLMLWIGTKVIALSKSCSFALDFQTGDGNTKDDGLWDSGEIVGAGWTMENQSISSADETVGNDLVYDQLLDLSIAGEAIDVSMGIPGNLNNEGVPAAGWQKGASYRHGKALITSVRLEGAKGSDSSLTISLKGVGALLKAGSGSGE